MRKPTRRYLGLIALLVALVLVLAACAKQTETPAPEPSPDPAPAAGGIQPPAEGQSPTIDRIRKNGKLRAGVAVAAPWLLQDPNDSRYYGPVVDLTEKIAAQLGVPVEYVDSGWDVIIAGLQSNKFDLAVAPLFASPQRMEVVDFVNYTTAGTCYFALKDNEKVKSMADLNKPEVSIVTFTGTGTEEGIKQKYPNAAIHSIVQPPGGQFAFEEVLSGRADVGPFDSPLAKFIAEKYPQFQILPQGPDYCIANADIPYPIGMAFAKGDTQLQSFLQAVVDENQDELDAKILEFSDPRYVEG